MGDRETQLSPAEQAKASFLADDVYGAAPAHCGELRVCRVRFLATARMQIAAREIVLWTTPSEPPKALQASECSELLDPMRASCLILAQHQPGKFKKPWDPKVSGTQEFSIRVLPRRGSNHAAGFPSLGAPWFKFARRCFFKAGRAEHHSVHFITNQSFAFY